MALSIVGLAACGHTPARTTSDAPPPSSSASPGGGTWQDLCKLADAHAARCNTATDPIKDCAKHTECIGDVFDPSAYAALAKCLPDADCEACSQAALDAPTPAGKALLAAFEDSSKRCSYLPNFVTLYGLLGAASSTPLTACEKGDCGSEAACRAAVDEKAGRCQASLGLNVALTLAVDVRVSVGDAGSPAPSGEAAPALVGKPAPEIVGDVIGAGKIPTMKSLKGKLVAVVFWASWSPPTMTALSAIDALAKTNKKKGLVVIGVATDDGADDVTEALKKNPVKALNVHDAKKQTTKAYGIDSLPTVVVVDRKGNVAEVMHGAPMRLDGITKRL